MADKNWLEAWNEVKNLIKISRNQIRNSSWNAEGEIKHAIDSFISSGGIEILETLPDEVWHIWKNSEAKSILDKNSSNKLATEEPIK